MSASSRIALSCSPAQFSRTPPQAARAARPGIFAEAFAGNDGSWLNLPCYRQKRHPCQSSESRSIWIEPKARAARPEVGGRYKTRCANAVGLSRGFLVPCASGQREHVRFMSNMAKGVAPVGLWVRLRECCKTSLKHPVQ